MIHRHFCAAVLASTLAACAGGAPALEYGMPSPSDVRYTLGDTTTVSISMMGQSLEMSQRGVVDYAVSFSPAAAGVAVTMSVTDLEGSLTQPMGAPIRIDEDDVSGVLVFSLDREGGVVVTETPEVAVEASQLVSGLAVAHDFFPGLPGRRVVAGDSWVDTVSYEGSEGGGERAETSVLRYTVVGDTALDGRQLLHITAAGTSESRAVLDVSGMRVTQVSEVEIEGHVLWDAEAGLMIERRTTAAGDGTASVPIAPNPIPIRIRSRRTVRLQGGSPPSSRETRGAMRSTLRRSRTRGSLPLCSDCWSRRFASRRGIRSTR